MTISRLSHLLVIAAVAGGVFSMTHGVSAQEATRLEEVMVTAQKREQGLSDVPVSITAFSKERLQNIAAPSYEELSGKVPGLQITGGLQQSIYLRGVGSGINKAFEQSAAQFIDGIYVGRNDQYLAPLLDMERVEVLRGAQGVLFGKNTIGGVINIVSSSPDLGEDFSGSVVAEYVPEWNTQRYEGFLNAALSDTFGIRLAGLYTESDGWVDNEYLDTTGPQNEDWAIRGTALWQATEALELNLKVSSSKTQVQGQASILPQFSLAAPPPVLLQTGFRLGVAAYSVATAAFPGMAEAVGKEFTTYLENTNTNNPTGVDLSSNNIVLNASLVLGDYEIKSTTSYSEFENDDGADVDFSALTFIAVGEDHEFSQYTQELTLYIHQLAENSSLSPDFTTTNRTFTFTTIY